jgi:hypothetical protein
MKKMLVGCTSPYGSFGQQRSCDSNMPIMATSSGEGMALNGFVAD